MYSYIIYKLTFEENYIHKFHNKNNSIHTENYE